MANTLNTTPGFNQNTDPTFITQQVIATFALRTFDPKVPSDDDLKYWVNKIETVNPTVGWEDYWAQRILTPDGALPATGGSANSNPSALIAPQLGLLEDDIVYRLAMLAVNILQPLRNQYPGIVVIGGFRQTNTGIGQHELAQAVDLQIRNQTPQLLYEVADFIQKNLPFDQLILNWTTVGTGQPWIHVSFSTQSNRFLVQTKDFADTFHQGLYLVDPQTGEDAAAQLRDNQTQTDAIVKELQNIQTRQQRMTTTTNNIDDLQEDGGSATSGGGPDGLGPDQLPQVDGVIYPLGNGWDQPGTEVGTPVNLLGQQLLSGTFGQAAIDAINAQFPSGGAIYYPSNNIYAVLGWYTALDKKDTPLGGAWDLIKH